MPKGQRAARGPRPGGDVILRHPAALPSPLAPPSGRCLGPCDHHPGCWPLPAGAAAPQEGTRTGGKLCIRRLLLTRQ